MATAYTSLLGLALPVTGELAGTWGDTVNNSITSLLDSAVSGTTTLSTDANVTLTTTTGASNQARQAILLCSGARTLLRTITAPAQSKMYVVINSTTGGFGVKIVGVGPTTGVTVANGKTAVVVWNGADFVEVAPAVATNLSGGAAGSLPYQTAASTTTFLGIGAANYVLTSTGTAPTWTLNTGTGSVVRATSPTITTPTITTSATVPLVIGGTGTTSTLALRSTSGIGATGADIIFQVGNNGATEAMRVLNSGNVGIGTNAPGAKLTIGAGDLQIDNAQYVRGKIAAGTTTRMLGINASDTLFIGSVDAAVSGITFNVNGTTYGGFDASGNASFTGNVTLGDATTDAVTVNGYMSVGGTPTASQGLRVIPAALTGTTQFGSVLSITATSAATVGVEAARVQAGTAAAAFTTVYAAGLWVRDAIRGAGSTITNNYGIYIDEKVAGTNNYGLATNIAAGANKWNLYIDGTAQNYFGGDVGVGTTTPETAFHAKAPNTVTGLGNGGLLTLENSSGAAFDQRAEILFKNVNQITSAISSSYTDFSAGPNYAGALIFATKATTDAAIVERMRIDSAGKVLVGATTARANYNNATFSPRMQIEGVDSTGSSLAITCNNTTDADGPILFFGKSATATVGSNTLVANGELLGLVTFAGNDGTEFVSAAQIKAEVDGTPGANDMPGRLVFSTTADGSATTAERMRINSTGNLLIGGTAPIGSSRVELLGTNDATSAISLYRSDLSHRTVIGANYIGTFTASAFDVYTNSTSRLSITSAGVVNIPNLTASQAVFTDASKNLVSNAITGTGNVVMSTSPTLVTPILGTPQSGNFSTGTFTWPTFNQNTTGTAAGLSATLVATSGGTGQSSYAIGDLLYASTTTALSKLADVATGNALISGGVGVAPAWGKIGLTTHVSGTLPVANGGTGITSLGTGVATWLGTPSSANLLAAMTDETGTGALVFGTSPTLATPTFTTSATFPLHIGGTTTTSPLTLRSTSGVGTTGADIIFQVGNNGATEAMRVLNNGNVGVGTNAPAFKLDVSGFGRFTTGLAISGGNSLQLLETANNNSWYFANNSNNLTFTYNSSERMRITSAGDVGIGTTTPGYPLHLSGAKVGSTLYGVSTNTDTTAGSGAGWAGVNGSVSVAMFANSFAAIGQFGTFTNHPAVFYTNTTERMRIDTAGNVLIDKTATNLGSTGIELKTGGYANFVGNLATTNELVNFNNINAGNVAYDIAFRQQSTIVGSIRVNSATTSYNPSSDARLKDKITPITNGLERVAKLKPVDYNWKIDGSLDNGFIAQDLLAEPDFANRVNAIGKAEDGSDMYGVDYMKFVAVLAAAIQELKAEIDALKGAK